MIHGEKFMEYEYEINRLQEIVKDKDIQLDSLLGQKWCDSFLTCRNI